MRKCCGIPIFCEVCSVDSKYVLINRIILHLIKTRQLPVGAKISVAKISVTFYFPTEIFAIVCFFSDGNFRWQKISPSKHSGVTNIHVTQFRSNLVSNYPRITVFEIYYAYYFNISGVLYVMKVWTGSATEIFTTIFFAGKRKVGPF